jgi:hypothetical protein
MPLGRIRLDITFGQPDNFCKEPLTFEVVNLHNVYHTILDCPCFAKFIAIPNYTYQKLKVPGPMGVITTNDSFEVAHYYEQDRVTQAATLVTPLQSGQLRPRRREGPGRGIDQGGSIARPTEHWRGEQDPWR